MNIGSRKGVSELKLANSGVALYSIVIPEEASPIEKNVAELLFEYLEKICGASFKIISDKTEASSREICLGATNRGGVSVQPGSDGYELRVEEERILIFGGLGRGLVNGVVAFLEEDLGCRWYAKDCEKIPKQKLLVVFLKNRLCTPQLKLRMPFHAYSFDSKWSILNRTNDPFARVPQEWGGHLNYPVLDGKKEYYRKGRRLFGHTYHTLMPPEEYFEKHPEYFMLNKDGKRIKDQVCESMPEVLNIFTANAEKYLRESPGSNLLCITKSDLGMTCQCEKCQSLNEKEGSESASMLFLVNHVAEKLEKEFPETLFMTYAYLETIKIPKTIRPRENVIMVFCNDKCSWTLPYPFKPARDHEETARNVLKWRRTGARLYFWDYVINFGHYCAPMPNFSVIADNIRFWAENNAEGVLTNGAYQSEGADRDVMRAWVTAKLMWDPSLEVCELMDEFIDGYYGRAKLAMKEYNRYLEGLAEKYDLANKKLKGGTRYGMDEEFVQNLIVNAEKFIVNAIELAENKTIRDRVERVSLSILYAKIDTWKGSNEEEYFNLIDRFERIARRTDCTFLSETLDTPDLDLHLKVWRGLRKGGLVEVTRSAASGRDAHFKVTVKSLVPEMKPSCTIDGSEPRTIFPLPEGNSFTVEINDKCRLKIALYLPASPFCKTVLEKDYNIEKGGK